MDDFHWRFLGAAEPQVMAKNHVLLQMLEREGVQAAAFFIGENVTGPIGLKVAESWGDAGHWIANHTFSHRNYNLKATTYDFFSEDAAKAHAALAALKNFHPLLRFPMLKEGETREKRDAMRSWMREHGYRNGHVAIDASDWLYAQHLAKRLEANPAYDTAKFRDAYIGHLLRMGRFFGGLAADLQLGDAPLTLLVHYNELNVRHLGDVIKAFRADGWQWVAASDAYRHPLYGRMADTVPGGESLIWALAKESKRFDERLRHQGAQDEIEEKLITQLQ